MSIRHKLLAVLALMTLVVVGLLAVMFLGTRETRERYAQLSDTTIPIARALTEVRFGTSQLDAAALAFISASQASLTPDSGAQTATPRAMFEHREKLRVDFERAIIDLDISIDEYGQLVDDEVAGQGAASPEISQLQTERERIVIAGDNYLDAAVAVLRAKPGSVSATGTRWAGKTFRDLKWGLLAAVHHAIEGRTQELAAADESVAALLEQTLRYAVIFSLLAIAIALACNYLLTGRIARPIMKLSDVAARVGKGDFGAAAELEGTGGRDEVGQLVASFRQMAGELETATSKLSRQERLAMLGQIAGTVSHELRNPLTAIRNSMALIRQVAAGKNLGVEKALDRVDRNIDRCTQIIGDLLEFTRVRDLNRSVTPFDDWLAETLDEHTVPAGVTLNRGLRFGGEVSMDQHRLRQVIVNLVDNAAQAMTDPTWEVPAERVRSITVRSEAAGPYLKLSVADTGCGIPAEKLPRIFEPLFTTKSFGVGLGLPTVRQIVEQHGGTIDVDSAVDRGTTFTIWLPRQQGQPDAGAAAAPPAREQAA